MVARHQGWATLAAAMLALAPVACNAPPQFAEVSGVVKLDGAPMPDALVQFLPDPEQGTRGPRSSAITDKEGRFRLVCDDERMGAVVGFHRVLIQDARTFPPPRNRQSGKEPPIMPPSRIAQRFEKATSTPLRQEVKAEAQLITLAVSGN